MRSVSIWVVLPLVLIAGNSPARNNSAPVAKEVKAEKAAKSGAGFEARMEDESVIRLALLEEHVRINTAYGPLKVPVGDIQEASFRLRPGAAVERRIRDAITDLSDDAYAKREAAKKTLLELAPASYTAVCAAARSEDLETSKRAKEIQGRLEERFSEDVLQRKPHDILQTPTMTIVGEVDHSSLKVRTTYFGEAQLKIEALRTMQQAGLVPNQVTVVVDAGQYAAITNNAWMETTIDVRPRTRLKIKASGEVNLWPQGGKQSGYMSGPGGAATVQGAMFRSGSLVGRLGKNGSDFLIGENYDQPPPGQGKLYLRIVTNPWGNPNEGKYTVVITQR